MREFVKNINDGVNSAAYSTYNKDNFVSSFPGEVNRDLIQKAIETKSKTVPILFSLKYDGSNTVTNPALYRAIGGLMEDANSLNITQHASITSSGLFKTIKFPKCLLSGFKARNIHPVLKLTSITSFVWSLLDTGVRVPSIFSKLAMMYYRSLIKMEDGKTLGTTEVKNIITELYKIAPNLAGIMQHYKKKRQEFEAEKKRMATLNKELYDEVVYAYNKEYTKNPEKAIRLLSQLLKTVSTHTWPTDIAEVSVNDSLNGYTQYDSKAKKASKKAKTQVEIVSEEKGRGEKYALEYRTTSGADLGEVDFVPSIVDKYIAVIPRDLFSKIETDPYGAFSQAIIDPEKLKQLEGRHLWVPEYNEFIAKGAAKNNITLSTPTIYDVEHYTKTILEANKDYKHIVSKAIDPLSIKRNKPIILGSIANVLDEFSSRLDEYDKVMEEKKEDSEEVKAKKQKTKEAKERVKTARTTRSALLKKGTKSHEIEDKGYSKEVVQIINEINNAKGLRPRPRRLTGASDQASALVEEDF